MKKFVFYDGLINDDIETLKLTINENYKVGSLVASGAFGLVTAIPVLAMGESLATAALPFTITTALVYLASNLTVEQVTKHG